MTSAPSHGNQPTPMLFFETIRGLHHAFAVKAAVELDLFTTIAKGNSSAGEIAKACSASSERGIRILCDHLAVLGFLTKTDGHYHLTQDSATFLDSRSPAYMGKAVQFLMHSEQFGNFGRLAETIRTGNQAGHSHLDPEDPIWLDFARGMAPMMFYAAQTIVQELQPALAPIPQPKILDIAASHGMFGIMLAQQHHKAEIYALDWANVLQVAEENAQKAGLANRYHLIPGSAFSAEIGSGYDAVLITNFLHHFDPATNQTLLKKFYAAMNPGGQLVILEFVPDEQRLSPPPAALFALVMLANTEHGDAYTFPELARMCGNAGFKDVKLIQLEAGPEALVMARK
jgi:2-polyprenyl-3-methyl-5-hydroxy-6-metoxy-1,4-benzoquinol methylase